jgi:sugar O-acyltransferase (sialic acid O-acetyltransferase NeuD family)
VRGVQPIAIVAAGGFGREVAWLVEEINAERPTYEFVGFLDDSATSTPEGWPVLGTVDAWIAAGRRDVHLVSAIGEPTTRLQVADKLARAGAAFATLVHPTVRRSRWVEIEAGSIVCAGCILTTNITLGSHSIVNLDCTIGHDSRLGPGSSLMPGVHVSGEVTLGRGVFIGTGANLINRVTVGDWAVIGAGAVVSRSLPGGQIAVGVPATPIKPNPRAPQDITS